MKSEVQTPGPIADLMAWWTTQDGAHSVFDPAVGSGMLGLAVVQRFQSLGRNSFQFTGVDVNAAAVSVARRVLSDLGFRHLANLAHSDFLVDALKVAEGKRVRWFDGPFDSVICNPPFARYHLISSDLKTRMGDFGERLVGVRPSGLSGLHLYFLIAAKRFVKQGGKLAFILPREFFSSTHGQRMWEPLRQIFSVDAQVIVDSVDGVFPGVDMTPSILLLTSEPQQNPTITLTVTRLEELDKAGRFIAQMLGRDGGARPGKLRTSAGPSPPARHDGLIPLSEIGFVKRGIATGSKSFFAFSSDKALRMGIPPNFLRPALTTTRQLRFFDFTNRDFDTLDTAGEFVWLFSAEHDKMRAGNEAVRRYLDYGESLGISTGTLCSARHPWYNVESRDLPALFFPYLWRESPRFVLNDSMAVGLNILHHIYIRDKRTDVRALAAVLNSRFVRLQLFDRSRTYARGLRKSEPSDLSSVLVPMALRKNVVARKLAGLFDRLRLESRLRGAAASLETIDWAVTQLL